MPIYEYRCLDCDRTFDKLRSMSRADEPIACTYCEGLNTRRAKVTPFMALSRSSGSGTSAAVAGTLEGCHGSCAGCSRPCGSRGA
jgi:putative FmdB family regulatory protein